MNARLRTGSLVLCLFMLCPLKPAHAQSSDSYEGWLILMMSWITTVVPIIGPTILANDLTSEPITEASQASLRDKKMLLAARDEAAAFVASHGVIMGVRLEAALQHLRAHYPETSDDQIAQAILAWEDS